MTKNKFMNAEQLNAGADKILSLVESLTHNPMEVLTLLNLSKDMAQIMIVKSFIEVTREVK